MYADNIIFGIDFGIKSRDSAGQSSATADQFATTVSSD